MKRAFLDSNVFLYATGAAHPYRHPCLKVLRLLRDGAFRGESSVEVAQEVAHVRFRRTHDRPTARKAGELIARACHLHVVEEADLLLALEMFERSQRLSVRDCVHGATALGREIGVIVSTDRDFDELEGLERIDPADPDLERGLGIGSS